jgi:hypothetical protein
MIDIQDNQVFCVESNFCEEEEFSPQSNNPDATKYVKVEEVTPSATGFDTEDSHLIDFQQNRNTSQTQDLTANSPQF